jgi:hypothetical protein
MTRRGFQHQRGFDSTRRMKEVRHLVSLGPKQEPKARSWLGGNALCDMPAKDEVIDWPISGGSTRRWDNPAATGR